MPNIAPSVIHDVLDATELLGVSRDVFDTTLHWHRSGTTQRAALHPAAHNCDISGKVITGHPREQHSFAELAEHNVCECVWDSTGHVGQYAQLVRAAAEYIRCVERCGTEPDWDTWLDANTQRAQALRLLESPRFARRPGGTYTYTRANRERGYGILPARRDTTSITRQIEDANETYTNLVTSWCEHPDLAYDWWATRYNLDRNSVWEHAMLVSRGATGQSSADRDRWALLGLIGAQFSVAASTGWASWLLVCAPSAVLDLVDTSDGSIDRFGTLIAAHQIPLLTELYDPWGHDQHQLVDVVAAALPNT